MRKAVDMWAQSKYWQERAAGAIRAAKYKERPDVRARRIKGLEADKRKEEKTKKDAETFLKLWENVHDESKLKRKDGSPSTILERAVYISNHDHVSKCFTLAEYPRDHHTYEGQMSLYSALADGIITGEQARDIAVPVHQRVIANCARWINHLENRLMYERAMMQESGGTAADRTGPEKGGACKCWASPGYGKGWSYIQKVNKVSVTVLDNWGNGGGNFTRNIPFDKLSGIMTAAQVQDKRDTLQLIESHAGLNIGFFLRDALPEKPEHKQTEPSEFDAMKDALREGVKVVVAPQLFPTPPEIAARMVEYAEIEPGQSILEPSAGTGNIVKAIRQAEPLATITAVEINRDLALLLSKCIGYPADRYTATNADFLTCNGDIGTFDRIIMNPPFENGADIKHIQHALTMLNPGGRLVALCANGSRQRAAFMDEAEHWENLPAGSFKEQGTGVNVALMALVAPDERKEERKQFEGGLF